MTLARDLADRFHQRWLEENPFAATMYGIPGYDDRVPDESEQGAQAWRAEVAQFLREADEIAAGPLTPAEAVTLDATRGAAAQELAILDMAQAEYTVTAMQYAGPAVLLALAARTVLVDPAAAEAYLTRLRRSGAWLDQIGERLRAGARKGRLPVAPLAEQAITWAEDVLAAPVPGPLLAPAPPPGWPGAASVGVAAARGGRGGGEAGAGQVGRHRQGAAPPGAPVGAGRAGPPARGQGRLRAGGQDLYDAAAARRKNCTRPAWTTSRRWRPGP